MPLALKLRLGAIWKRRPKLAPFLAFTFSHGCLALALIFYPAFLQLGAYNGSGETATRERYDFCALEEGESAQSCAISTRLFVRAVQSASSDARACLQASSFGKFVLHPRRSGNWDKASLRLYANVWGDSDWESKWLKARMAIVMLKWHRKIDERCRAAEPAAETVPIVEMPGP